MIAVPNLLLTLLRAASWLLWRDPVDTKPKHQPKPPRRPLYHFAVSSIPEHIHAVVRTTWFKRGMAVEVDQIEIDAGPDAPAVFDYYVGQALRQGADVSVLSRMTPEDLGITSAIEV